MTVLSLAVAAQADDGYQGAAVGFNAAATQLYVGHLGGAAVDAWMWFHGATVPQGTSGIAAELQMTRRENGTGTCAWKVQACDADDPSPPTDGTTYGALAWTTAQTTGSDASPATQEIDCSSAVQEVVDRPGFGEDKIGMRQADNGSSSNNYLINASYDATQQEPRLEIIYSAGGGLVPIAAYHYNHHLVA